MTLTAICRQWQANTTKGRTRVHVLADDSVIKAFYTLSNAHFDNTAIKGYPKQIPIVIIGRIEFGLFGQSNLDDFRLSKTN
jgi:hypothetical protein